MKSTPRTCPTATSPRSSGPMALVSIPTAPGSTCRSTALLAPRSPSPPAGHPTATAGGTGWAATTCGFPTNPGIRPPSLRTLALRTSFGWVWLPRRPPPSTGARAMWLGCERSHVAWVPLGPRDIYHGHNVTEAGTPGAPGRRVTSRFTRPFIRTSMCTMPSMSCTTRRSSAQARRRQGEG